MRKFSVFALGLLVCGLMLSEARAEDARYDVLYPLGKQMTELRDVGASLPELNGKTICELSNYRFRFAETFPVLRALLQKNYPDIKIIPYEEFGNLHGHDERAVNAALQEKLVAFGCDAVISGNGC